MNTSISKIKKLLPAHLLDKMAIEYKVNARNQVKLSGQTVFLCLLNGLLNHPSLSQRLLEEQYKKMTGKECDHSAFGKRFSSINTDFFRAILTHLQCRIGASIGKGDIGALKLRIVDATIVTLSAKILKFGIRANHGNKGVKRQVKSVIELSDEGLPNLLHVCKTQSEYSDAIALGKTMKSFSRPNDLWIFDKGCHGRQALFDIHNAGSFWLTPHSQQGLSVIKTVYDDNPSVPPLPEVNEAALIIYRVEQAIFSNKWDKIADLDAMKLVVIHCYRWDTRAKCWKKLVLMTNMPLQECETKAGEYSFQDITELYRRRWEIETFFKFIKQHLGYEHLVSLSENGIQIMVLMTMITALLMIWYKQQTEIKNGWKAVKFWLADDVQTWTRRSVGAMKICQT